MIIYISPDPRSVLNVKYVKVNSLNQFQALKKMFNITEEIHTFMVSRGCPTKTVHIPPNPPQTKYSPGPISLILKKICLKI